MTLEWMFEPEEYVPDYSAHVRAAKATLHDKHVQTYSDHILDLMLARMGARRVRPGLVRVSDVGVQPLSGPVPLALFQRAVFKDPHV
jgi:hypothetical protein